MEIGLYKIFKKIWESGISVIYSAEQQSPVRRKVMLKLVKWERDLSAKEPHREIFLLAITLAGASRAKTELDRRSWSAWTRGLTTTDEGSTRLFRGLARLATAQRSSLFMRA